MPFGSKKDVVKAKPKPNPIHELRNNTAEWWYKDPGMRALALPIFLGFCSSIQSGYDATVIAGLQANIGFWMALGVPSSIVIGAIVAGQPIGSLPGLIPAAIATDKLGRKKTQFIGYVFLVGSAFFLAWAKGAWLMFGARVFHGFWSGVTSVSSGPYTTEIAHPRNRAVVTALIQTCWFTGAVLSAWVCFGCLHIDSDWSWRLPLLLQMVVPVIALCIIPFVPESPRWLTSHGRQEEAHRILARYHANGDMNDELVLYEMKEISAALEIGAASKDVSYGAFIATKGMRHRLLILITCGFGSQMVGNGIITFYIVPILTSVGITSGTDQAIYNACLQIWNWLSAVAGALACERFGRRPLWLTSIAGQFVSYAIITACSAVYEEQGNESAGFAVLAFLYIYFFFYAIAFTGLTFAYPLEILPFEMRAKGFSIMLICSISGVIFNTFVNPIAMAAIAWKYYFVWIGCITVVAVIMYFYYPETKGLILEEISRIFDGPQTGKDIIAASGPSADTDEAKEKEEAAAGRLDDNIAQLHFQSSNQEV